MGESQMWDRIRKRWLTFGGVATAGVILVLFAFWPRPQVEVVDVERLGDDPALGPESARVTIVEYGDFGCPACKAWHRAGVLKDLRARYGGQIRFVYRDFPVITPQSPKAAEAAQCAYEQGKFWQYHDLLFSSTGIGVDQLKTYASEIGLDVPRFNQCLDSGRYGPTVDQDLQDAIHRGFLGTPGFLVNDQPIDPDASPNFEYFQRLVEPILASGR